jgi:crotonobetainyl-CoA:carnitine CoA-transferase CaiB-like acyl-CoA transferase
MSRSGPFSGLKVVELSRLLPGAYATLLFADLGANVVKVEEPGRGDYMRWIEPMSAPDYGALFSATGRNKRSITVNLKTAEGRDVVLDLIAEADVVVEGFRPGVADRLGIGYAAASERNPCVVYCAISGYGQSGPLADRPGHDLNYLAAAGVLDMTGDPSGPPAIPGPQLADVWGGGLTPAFAVLAALWERERTGRGRYLDVGMYDGTAAVMINHAAAWLAGGTRFERGNMLLSGGVPNYGVWEAADGWVTLGCTEEKFWRRACELIGEPELAAAHNATGEEAEAARARLRERFKERTRAEWEALLGGPETCFASVLTMEEALEDDHFHARGLLTEVALEDGPERQVTTAVDRLGEGEHRRAPGLGEHTDELLAALGRSPEQVGELRAAGAI